MKQVLTHQIFPSCRRACLSSCWLALAVSLLGLFTGVPQLGAQSEVMVEPELGGPYADAWNAIKSATSTGGPDVELWIVRPGEDLNPVKIGGVALPLDDLMELAGDKVIAWEPGDNDFGPAVKQFLDAQSANATQDIAFMTTSTVSAGGQVYRFDVKVSIGRESLGGAARGIKIQQGVLARNPGKVITIGLCPVLATVGPPPPPPPPANVLPVFEIRPVGDSSDWAAVLSRQASGQFESLRIGFAKFVDLDIERSVLTKLVDEGRATFRPPEYLNGAVSTPELALALQANSTQKIDIFAGFAKSKRSFVQKLPFTALKPDEAYFSLQLALSPDGKAPGPSAYNAEAVLAPGAAQEAGAEDKPIVLYVSLRETVAPPPPPPPPPVMVSKLPPVQLALDLTEDGENWAAIRARHSASDFNALAIDFPGKGRLALYKDLAVLFDEGQITYEGDEYRFGDSVNPALKEMMEANAGSAIESVVRFVKGGVALTELPGDRAKSPVYKVQLALAAGGKRPRDAAFSDVLNIPKGAAAEAARAGGALVIYLRPVAEEQIPTPITEPPGIESGEGGVDVNLSGLPTVVITRGGDEKLWRALAKDAGLKEIRIAISTPGSSGKELGVLTMKAPAGFGSDPGVKTIILDKKKTGTAVGPLLPLAYSEFPALTASAGKLTASAIFVCQRGDDKLETKSEIETGDGKKYRARLIIESEAVGASLKLSLEPHATENP